MKIIKNDTQFGPTYILQDKNTLTISYAGNGDLYLSIYSKGAYDEKTFVITKENYELYKLFEQLFYDIKNINIFDNEEDIEFEKDKYRLYNYANYFELYDDENEMITWYSDETAHEVANILKIKKSDDSFYIRFYIQSHYGKYDEDYHTPNNIQVRVRNSGSRYNPFNTLFMKMYFNMSKLDENNHQMNIYEYLHDKEEELVRKKNS